MLVVYDAHHAGHVPIGEEVGQSLFVLLEKRRFNALFNHQIVRCDAGLTGVEHLAESDAPRGERKVCCLVHDDGALAAELERHRSEPLCGGLHDGLADGDAAGKEYVVKRFIEQRLVRIAPALDGGDEARRECGLYKL